MYCLDNDLQYMSPHVEQIFRNVSWVHVLMCNKTFDGAVHKVMQIFSVTVSVTPGCLVLISLMK